MFRKHLLIAVLGLATFMPLFSVVCQENVVNQRRIERERIKKQKLAQKEYKQALKRHISIQTRETKAAMKRSRKNAGKLTPIKH